MDALSPAFCVAESLTLPPAAPMPAFEGTASGMGPLSGTSDRSPSDWPRESRAVATGRFRVTLPVAVRTGLVQASEATVTSGPIDERGLAESEAAIGGRLPAGAPSIRFGLSIADALAATLSQPTTVILPVLALPAPAVPASALAGDQPSPPYGSPGGEAVASGIADDSVSAATILQTVRQFRSQTAGLVPLMVLLMASDEAGGETNLTVDLMQAGAYSVVWLPDGTAAPAGATLARLRGQLQAAANRSLPMHAKASRRLELQTRYDRLTRKERDVLTRIERGESNRQIATALDISVRAVEDRRSRAMKRMQAGSLVELIHLLRDLAD